MNTNVMESMPTAPDEYIGNLSEKVVRLLSAWQTLSAEEQAEFLKASHLIGGLTGPSIDHIRQIIINVRTGPYGEPCPYCGRG